MTFEQLLVITSSLGGISSFIFLCGIFDALSPEWRIILPSFPHRKIWKSKVQDLALYSIATPVACFFTYISFVSL